MDVKDLIKKDSREVRGNSNLMSIYIDAFQKQFGYKPSCAGCTFGNDFAKLVRAVQTGDKPTERKLKSNKMENTFKLKKIQGKILSYKANGKTFRAYDNTMKEDFVVGYLTNGSKEEIAERKKLFAILPVELQDKKDAKKFEAVEEKIEESKEETTQVETETAEAKEEPKGEVKVRATRKKRTKK